MQKIKAALKRLHAATGKFHQVRLADDYGFIAVTGGCDVSQFWDYTEDSIVAEIDRYIESLKPKPRPIPEIVKDLKFYFEDRIISDTLSKLLDELQNSPAATFPF